MSKQTIYLIIYIDCDNLYLILDSYFFKISQIFHKIDINQFLLNLNKD